MGCAYISTRGQLAPALASALGKTVAELDTANGGKRDGMFTPCDLLYPPITVPVRKFVELGTLTFLFDNGNGYVDGDDVLVSQTTFWKDGHPVNHGFTGGRLKNLIAGYESGGNGNKPGEVVPQFSEKNVWAVRFWAAIRAQGTTSCDLDDPRLKKALKIAGPVKSRIDLDKP